MQCPKCKSNKITVQFVSESKLKTKHRGIIYWFLFGWVWEFLLWILLTLPMLIITIFKPKKYKMVTKHKKVAVCNDCGYSWNVKG